MALDNLGQPSVGPCCYYPVSKTAGSVADWINSDELHGLQNHMLTQDTLPQACNKCQRDEQLGFASLRQKHSRDRIQQKQTKITEIEIMPSNTCNLSCVSCRPDISTGVGQEWKKLGWISQLPQFEQTHSVIEAIQQLPDLSTIGILGGEFFVTKNNLQILDLAVEKKLGLKLVTNGTNITPHHIQRLKSIAEIDITVSTDAMGTAFEFLRYPAKWSQVDNNITELKQHLPQARIQLNTLQHPLTCEHMISVFEYANRHKMLIQVIPIQRPAWLTWHILNDQETQRLADLLAHQAQLAALTKVQKLCVDQTVSMLRSAHQFDATIRSEAVRVLGTLVKHRGYNQDSVRQVFGALTELADEVWHHLSDSNARPPAS